MNQFQAAKVNGCSGGENIAKTILVRTLSDEVTKRDYRERNIHRTGTWLCLKLITLTLTDIPFQDNSLRRNCHNNGYATED